MPACEHCHHDPDVSKAALDQTKSALEIAKREAAKAIGDSAAIQAQSAELAKFKAETEPAIAKLNGDLGRASQDVVLARRGFVDEAKARGFRAAYGIYAAETGAQAVAFDAYLDGPAKADPFLAPHFVVAVPQAVAAPPVATPPKVNPLPGSNAGAVAETQRQGIMSPRELGEYFRSPGFMGLTSEAKKAKRNELEQQVAAARRAPA